MSGNRLEMQILHREGLARIGRFKTDHGFVDTPNIMPVINPNIRTLSMDIMKKLGTQAIITNSYIIRRNEDLKEIALSKGLHHLIGFDGTIMTDSGTFQSYVYGDVEYENRDTVEFQLKIKSDISTILDIFSTPMDSWEKANQAVDETHKRFMEIADLAGKNNISGPIQGSVYDDLRVKSAKLMSGTDSTYLPIGGVVPLLEQYRYSKLVDIIINSKLNSDFSKPIHLFGGGHPMFMGMAVLLGVDMFDSASYVKYARDDRLLYPDGTRNLKDITELPYWSPLRDRFSTQELRKAEENEKFSLLAEHNLFAIFQELSEIRERIRENTLWQYVESKSKSHPSLYSAFRRILRYSENLEPYFELYRKSPLFHFGEETNQSPYGVRLKKLQPSDTDYYTLSSGDWKPARLSKDFVKNVYEKTEGHFYINWFGLKVPLEMEEAYPVEQVIPWNEEKESGSKKPIPKDIKIRDFNLEKLRFLADFQFGENTGKKLFTDNCEIAVSRATGRIRTITREGKIIATMRAHDGFIGLTFAGGLIIHGMSEGIKNRVMVTEESATYNSQGKSVFFKFITNFDDRIIPLNDVLVVDPNDRLVAVGRSMVSGKELGMYREGTAVSINHHLE
ncbi:MAG: tRNA guanosine(15) transglycosylase TgtA [Cuniculiplasma sp.]